MPDITFDCPHCQARIEADDDMAGTAAACPSCNGQIQVPRQRIQLRQPQSVAQQPMPGPTQSYYPSAPSYASAGTAGTSSAAIWVAAILSFIVALILGLVSVAGLVSGEGFTGAWNMAIAVVYVVIGVGLIRRRPAALSWGIGTNVLNGIGDVIRIFSNLGSEGDSAVVVAMGVFVALEIGILIALVCARNQFEPQP